MGILVKWFILLAVIAIAAMLGTWIAGNPGDVQVDWMGYRITSSLWVLMVAALLVLVLGFLLIGLVMKLFSTVRIAEKKREIKSYEKGLSSLTKTINLLSLKEYDAAKKQLAQLRKHLGDDAPLVPLLQAHLASRTGDEASLMLSLEQMREHDETKHLALTSLTRISNNKHNIDDALHHAREAYTLRPSHTDTALQYLHILLQTHKYDAAVALCEEGARYKAFTKPQAQRYTAIAYYCNYASQRDGFFTAPAPAGTTLIEQHDREHSVRDVSLLAKSFSADNGFTPAYRYITALHEQGKARQAMKHLLKAWKTSPHPELSDILLHYFAADSDEKLLKRAQAMLKMWPDHIESHLLVARASLQAGKWDNARNHLKAALNIAPQMRVFELLATLEEKSGQSESAMSAWLKRMHHAQPNPAWQCTSCGHINAHWQLQCSACNSFDGYSWKEQPASVSNEIAHLPEVSLS